MCGVCVVFVYMCVYVYNVVWFVCGVDVCGVCVSSVCGFVCV